MTGRKLLKLKYKKEKIEKEETLKIYEFRQISSIKIKGITPRIYFDVFLYSFQHKTYLIIKRNS